jgi:hypothetical protein
MATVRYQVDDVPQSAWAHAWFPTPGLSPAGSSNQQRFISGFPGTMRVDSPKPAGAFRASTSPEFHSPSEVAPPWFAPQIWYDDLRGGRPVAPTGAKSGIAYLPHLRAHAVVPVVPIGTVGPLGPSKVAMGGRKVGGRRSMHWPRTVIRWPNLAGRYP